MQCLALTLLALVMIFLLIFLCSAWSSGLITGAYFDKKLKDQGLPLMVVFAAGFSRRCVRAAVYLLLILLNGNPFVKRKYRWYPNLLVKRYRKIFGATDFRLLARKQDWVLAIIMWGSGLLCAFFTLMACLLVAYLRYYGVI